MNPTEMAEAVERARRGEREGFTEIYEAYGRRVLGLCRHLLGSPDAAQDALSVTSHHCLDILRRRRLESRLFAAEWEETDSAALGSESDPSPLATVLTDEGRGRVRDALLRLPERYRVSLALRYYGELGYDEIASQLGVTRNHVAILIFRGKQALRRLLADLDERT